MKMNKKIVIALAVLAAFMMLAIPLATQESVDATTPADITGENFVSGEVGKVVVSNPTEGTYAGYTVLQVQQDLNLTSQVAISSGKYAITSAANGTGVFTVSGVSSGGPLFYISGGAEVVFDGPNITLAANSGMTSSDMAIKVNATSYEQSSKLVIKSGTITDARGAFGSSSDEYQRIVHATGKSTFEMLGGHIVCVWKGVDAPSVTADYSNESSNNYYQNYASVFLGSETKSTLSGGVIDILFSNYNEFGQQDAYFKVNGEVEVGNLWIEYDSGTKTYNGVVTENGNLTVTQRLVVSAEYNSGLTDNVAVLKIEGEFAVAEEALVVINGEMEVTSTGTATIASCAQLYVNGTIDNQGGVMTFVVTDDLSMTNAVNAVNKDAGSGTSNVIIAGDINANVGEVPNNGQKYCFTRTTGIVNIDGTKETGGCYTITATGTNSESGTSLLMINAPNANEGQKYTVKNLALDAAGIVFHPFNAYGNDTSVTINTNYTKVSLDNVTAKNGKGAGINVLKNADVTIKDVSTSGNIWVGVRVGINTDFEGSTLPTDAGAFVSKLTLVSARMSENYQLWIENIQSIGACASTIPTTWKKISVDPADFPAIKYAVFYAGGNITKDIDIPENAKSVVSTVVNATFDSGDWNISETVSVKNKMSLIAPQGATLGLTAGSTLRLEQGARLTVSGTIINNGTIVSVGTVTNNSGATLTNAGVIRFEGGSVINKGTINNTGEIAFVIGMATADPGTTGLVTSGENGKVTWYNNIAVQEPVPDYYIASGASGSFKMTGIYSGNTLTGIKTEFTAGSAIITTVGNNTNDVWTIASGVTVTLPESITIAGAVTNNGTIVVDKDSVNSATILTVDGTLTNAGVINVEGTLMDSYSAAQDAQMIINTNGTINVTATGTLKVGYFTGKGVNIDGKINFATGGKFLNNAGTENTLIAGTESALILMTAGTVSIDAKEVGGAVTYTLQDDAKATFTQSNVAGFAFKAGDVIDIDGELTVVTTITVPEGAKLNVNGKVTGGDASVITLDKSASLDIGSAGAVLVGTIDMTGSNSGVKAVMIKAGGVITALVDGSTSTAALSKAKLENITAGNGGLSIIKGSVYINGTLATPDNTGKITVPAGAVKISGNVEEGVTLEVPAGSSVVIPKDSTLTFEEGSKFNYDNGATITFEEKSSSIIYEKGSEVNDVEIEVETKEDSEGTTVAVHIYLVSENEKKLIISVDYVEVLPGKTYGDALNGVIVAPTKKSVTFDGWYNLAFNEKIRSTDIVGNNDVTLTACFSDEGRVPVQKEDTPSETIIIDGTSDNSQSFAGSDFALPVAIICLIVAILALGFVVLKKR